MSDNQPAAATKLPERFTISGQLLQETLNYLATQPLGQVLGLFNAIQQDAKPLTEEK